MIAAYVILYLVFQVGIFGFVRSFNVGNNNGFTAKMYKISMIPLFGILYVLYLIFTYLLKED